MYEIIIPLPFNGFHLKGVLSLPVTAKSIVIFSPGFGSIRMSPHEEKIAHTFHEEGFATLFFDLPDQSQDFPNSYKNIDILSHGLTTATQWLHGHSEYNELDLAYFGSGTGAAIALKSTVELGPLIKTVISLSGQLKMVKEILPRIPCPTLLITGELDFEAVNISYQASQKIKSQKQLAVVPGASHLFEETGKLKEAAKIAISWSRKYLSVGRQPTVLF